MNGDTGATVGAKTFVPKPSSSPYLLSKANRELRTAIGADPSPDFRRTCVSGEAGGELPALLEFVCQCNLVEPGWISS